MNAEQRTERARTHFMESAAVKHKTMDTCMDAILAAASLISAAFAQGHQLLLCGNGGSAADCQHMAAEFTSRLTQEFVRPALPAIALTTDTSFLTAFTNDMGFEGVFGRLIEAIGKPGDVLLGISTSGNSANVIHAVETARKQEMHIITMTGSTGRLKDIADVAIAVPSQSTQFIQESHLTIEHIICDLVEQELYGKTEV